MDQCVRITLIIKAAVPILKQLVQKNAQKLAIEGVGNIIPPHTVKIIAHGQRCAIDEFIDVLYTGYKGLKPLMVEVEPFVKDRDYRGVFRVIG